MKLFKDIYSRFVNRKTEEQLYLEDSVDAVDLERRQRILMNGQAPFQQVRIFGVRNYGW